MPTPQFAEVNSDSGFDGGVFPSWQLVGQGSRAEVYLTDATRQMVVTSLNPRIAEIRDITAPPAIFRDRRQFSIQGHEAGRTHIVVSDPDHGGRVTTRLEVLVRPRKVLNIAFHFVEDQAGQSTTRLITMGQTPEVYSENRVVELTGIFDSQVNISFVMTRAARLKVDANLREVFQEGRNAAGMAGQPVSVSMTEWGRLIARGDPGANFNVFFVPDLNPSPPDAVTYFVPVLTRGNDFLYRDDMMTNPADVLAFEIGRSFGCPISGNPKELMYQNPSRRRGNFIPKHCAVRMWWTTDSVSAVLRTMLRR
jgi:hypothetical protein